jgi:hypothetical protein
MTESSLNTIGEAFGGRDHGTVLHACRLVKDRMEVDANVRQVVTTWKNNCSVNPKPGECLPDRSPRLTKAFRTYKKEPGFRGAVAAFSSPLRTDRRRRSGQLHH